MENLNIGHYLLEKNIAAGREAKIAIKTANMEVTYGEIEKLSNKFGNGLKSLRVQREQRILLLLGDKPEFIISFIGAIKIGAVPVAISTMLKPKEYEFFLNDSRAKVLVIDNNLYNEIKPILVDLEFLENIILVENSDSLISLEPRPENGIDFETFLKSESEQLSPIITSKDEPAFWMYSSGSTGKPKGTIHLQHDIYHAADCLATKYYGIEESDLCYSISKMFFAYGLGNSFWLPFWAGATSFLSAEPSTPASVMNIVAKQRPTFFWGVPSLYNAVLNYIAENDASPNFSSVKRFFSAGEVLSSKIFELWQKLTNKPIYTVLGSTEALQGYIAVPIKDPRPGTLGKPIPGYEAKIVDEMGQEVTKGEVGTIWIKGDSVAVQYWNQHEKSKKTFIGEWLNSGDKGYEDDQGFYWYVGRNDDMLKVGGLWVSPTEIEESLIKHEAVKECAVVKGTNSQDLTYPIAFVVLKDSFKSEDSNLDIELKNYVKEQIEPYKYPRSVVFVTELPRSSTGKVQRFKLKSFADQEAENYSKKRRSIKDEERIS